ncbi:MAG: YqgE/AlgH family protein [Puniceicoccales bacterium]|jgi:putative transcriptional regulator|nr:YqgE/AlgH family protein [Puniceicoccales bacterium]
MYASQMQSSAPEPSSPLSGQLLVSHPSLLHDAFRRTVVFLVRHGAGGAFGTILNRPTTRRLGEVASGFQTPPLGDLPLYQGGPVGENQLAFCGWNRTPEGLFHIHFGLSKERAATAADEHPGIKLRAILGSTQWAPGQLEDELRRHAWVVARADPHLLMEKDGEALWHAFLDKCATPLRFLAAAPDDVQKN